MTIPVEVVDASQKLLLAFVLAGLLGLERERKGRAAGLRTHIVVCLGSTLAMIVSSALSNEWLSHETSLPFDRGRIAAGILQGIGFIGAGTIINVGNVHRGLTTAAMLWFVAVLGISIGLGYYTIAVCATAFALAAVLFLERLSEYAFAPPAECLLDVEICSGISGIHEVERFVEARGYIVTVSRIEASAEGKCVTAEYVVNGKPGERIELLLDALQKNFADIRKLSLQR